MVDSGKRLIEQWMPINEVSNGSYQGKSREQCQTRLLISFMCGGPDAPSLHQEQQHFFQ